MTREYNKNHWLVKIRTLIWDLNLDWSVGSIPVFVLFSISWRRMNTCHFGRSHESRTKTLLLMLYHEKMTESQLSGRYFNMGEASFALLTTVYSIFASVPRQYQHLINWNPFHNILHLTLIEKPEPPTLFLSKSWSNLIRLSSFSAAIVPTPKFLTSKIPNRACAPPSRDTTSYDTTIMGWNKVTRIIELAGPLRYARFSMLKLFSR